MSDHPVYLVRGDDASLVAQAARRLLGHLLGERDSALVVEEHGGPGADEVDVGAVIDSCMTPPFLADLRVVVVRDAGRLGAGAAERLVGYLGDPMPSTALVLIAGGGTLPAALVKAVTAGGEVLDASVGTGRRRAGWLVEQVRRGPVGLDAAATDRLGNHLGDDLGRLDGILHTLAVAYGDGAALGVADVEPFLGEAGAVPPWELTDALDSGSSAAALDALRRMLGPGGRAAPEVVAILHRHFGAMLRLDGTKVASDDEAARLIGARSPFVARKAREQGRRMGSERIGRAVVLVADADVDVKGRTGLPPEVVLEVLVARLSRLVPGGRRPRR